MCVYTKILEKWRKPHLNWLATTSCVAKNPNVIQFTLVN